MLEINLLPVREARRAANLRQYVMQALLVVIVCIGGVGLHQSRIRFQLMRAEGRVEQMQNDIDLFKPQLEQVARFKKRRAELENKIQVIHDLDKARSGPVRMLSELASSTPERLWLTSLASKGGRIALKGKSVDNSLVALFLRQLGDSKVFENVDLDSARLSPSKRGLKSVQFSIKADLAGSKKPEPKKNKKNRKKKKKKRKA
jgi:type IV pilus assembly protein PilN